MLAYYPVKRSPGTRKEYDYQVRTVCQECAVGCGLLAYVRDGAILEVHGEEEHPISRGRLCARGTAFIQGVSSPERLTRPAYRKDRREGFQELDDLKRALDLLAERLRKIREQHGPDSLLIGCDPEGGLDFYLGALRFASLWGTSQVFHPLGQHLHAWPGELNSPSSSCSDWVHSRCLFLVEADLATTHPVAFSWVLEAQRRGAQIVAADTRFTATLSKADATLRIKPGNGNLLGLALMKLMLAESLHDAQAVEAGFTEVSSWQASFEQMSLEGAEAALGVSWERLRHLGRLLSKSGAVTLITGRSLGDLPHHRIWLTMATAMGWLGQLGGGWYPLESGTPLLQVHTYAPEAGPRHPEGGHHEILQKLREADKIGTSPIRAVICSGNCLFDYLSPFGNLAQQVDLVTHFGSFPNATYEQAHLMFPAALWAERDGFTFSNDRAIQWGRRIVEPPEGCLTGLDFWMGLAQRFGWEVHFPWETEDGRADEVAFYTWLPSQSACTAGLKVERLKDSEAGAAQILWPVGKAGLLHAAPPYFPTPEGKIAPLMAAATLAPSAETQEAADYPLYFQITQISCRSGDASHFWPWTRALGRDDAVQINPETARVLGIEAGDEVLLESPRGTRSGRAWLSRMVPRWLVASPLGVGGNRVLIRKKDQPRENALNLLREVVS